MIFFVNFDYIFSALVTEVREAHGFRQCSDKCFAEYGYDLGAVACLAVCGKKYPNGRSLEYTPDVVAVIVDQTTSAREARDNKDQECKEKCANRYGGSAINTFGCYIDCKERNRDRSLDKIDDVRQARSKFEDCKDNCIKNNGYTFLTAPCIHGCYYGGRSLQ